MILGVYSTEGFVCKVLKVRWSVLRILSEDYRSKYFMPLVPLKREKNRNRSVSPSRFCGPGLFPILLLSSLLNAGLHVGATRLARVQARFQPDACHCTGASWISDYLHLSNIISPLPLISDWCIVFISRHL